MDVVLELGGGRGGCKLSWGYDCDMCSLIGAKLGRGGGG